VIQLAIATAIAVLTSVALWAFRAGDRSATERTVKLLLDWERGKRELPPGSATELATEPTLGRKALHGRAKGKKR
jgi:hypothetical protein